MIEVLWLVSLCVAVGVGVVLGRRDARGEHYRRLGAIRERCLARAPLEAVLRRKARRSARAYVYRSVNEE